MGWNIPGRWNIPQRDGLEHTRALEYTPWLKHAIMRLKYALLTRLKHAPPLTNLHRWQFARTSEQFEFSEAKSASTELEGTIGSPRKQLEESQSTVAALGNDLQCVNKELDAASAAVVAASAAAAAAAAFAAAAAAAADPGQQLRLQRPPPGLAVVVTASCAAWRQTPPRRTGTCSKRTPSCLGTTTT